MVGGAGGRIKLTEGTQTEEVAVGCSFLSCDCMGIGVLGSTVAVSLLDPQRQGTNSLHHTPTF